MTGARRLGAQCRERAEQAHGWRTTPLGIPRSELYAPAVAEHVAEHRHQDLTARLAMAGVDAGLRLALDR